MLILLLAWFFVLGQTARAAEPPAHLWHFDECEGNILKDSAGAEDLPQNTVRVVGKWQCAINQPWQSQYYIEKTFSAPLPAGELTLSFYWRNSAFPNEGRNHLYLKKADGQVAAGIRPSIYTRNLYFNGVATTSIPAMPSDSNWHLITVTYSQAGAVLYMDGVPKKIFNGNYAISSPIASLEMKGENWPVDMDELAIWPRALSAVEAAEIYQANKPLEPYIAPVQPEKAQLIHLWHFDEGAGMAAADSAGATALSPIVKWTDGKFGKGMEHTWRSGYLISQDLDQAITSKDLSIDFWWQNSAYPNEGRVSLDLENSAGVKIFGIRPSIYSGRYYFDGNEIVTGDIFPHDNAWHHLALVYDSYNFYVAFYVDGVEKIKVPKVWFRRPITKLVIRGENWVYKIDELAIWQGALSQAEIKDYYNSGQPHSAVTAPDPVIVVPGIMGSWEVNGQWKLDPIMHTYDNLWQAMKNVGYKEDKTLFAFPYEWRQDNVLTAYQLKQKIDEVKSVCHCNKVDIVAHSMGGLAARYYAESDYYGGDIDQLVFLGTPHKGAPEAYLRWEGATGEGLKDQFANIIFGIEAHARGNSSLFDYIQNYVKSVEQLLPDYEYLQDANQASFRIYNSVNHPDNYPYNAFLENINSAENINQLNNSGIRIKNFIGDTGDNTINAIRVSSGEPYWPMWQHGYAEESIRLAGDNTVPEVSTSMFTPVKVNNSAHDSLPTKAQKQIIQILTGNLSAEEITATKMPNILLVVRIFSPADFIIIAPNGEKLGKDFLSGQAVSEIPGAFYSGFSTNEEFAVIPDPQDGEYKVQLQGTGQGEYKLSTSLIDDNQETSREFSGIIAPAQIRDFNITYSSASENPISELEPIDTVPPVIVINKPMDGEEYPYSDNLVIDYTATDDFSGIANTKIILDGQEIATTSVKLSDYSLGQYILVVQAIDKAGNQAEAQVNFTIIDNMPPIVAINLPVAGAKYLHSDSLIIDYSATDDFSGIATTSITIDGRTVVATKVDLFDYSLGVHNLVVIAEDKAGNQTQAQVNFEITADIDSTISDIKEIYERGWLKKGLYRALLENAFKLLKIEAKYFERERELTEKLIKKTGADSKLNAKQKQKLIEQYDKKLAELKKNRVKAIGHSLDTIVVLLNNAKKQSKLNQIGYDIILSDINYLRENL